MFFATNLRHILLLTLLLAFTACPRVKSSVLTQEIDTAQVASGELGCTEESLQAAAGSVEKIDEADPQQRHAPSPWLVLPFIILLSMIATGPLLYERYWHRNYPKIAILLAAVVIGYYLFVLHNVEAPVEALVEYVQFIALIASLYITSGGILIEINRSATPFVNVVLLLTGALLANLIGTTGASMLLIRPYIRLNQASIKVYHIVFFIFMVSNVGGALTPIGDPPLFLGFLKGVPFFWTLKYNTCPWLVALLLLSVIFYFLDKSNKQDAHKKVFIDNTKPTLSIKGKKNFIWLAIIIFAVFLDPSIFAGLPAIHYQGHAFSFLRELIMLSVAWLSYRYAEKHILERNQFNFEPIKEVVFLFIGIFGTMPPALTLVRAFAQSEAGSALITHNTLYWGTGTLSAFLDNAPTYLSFLAASMATHGADINQVADVKAYALGTFHNSIRSLETISIAAVFFGAMTYIGNGPNFMIKSIAGQRGIRMPSFLGYIIRFSLPFLLPILVVVWLLFFAFEPI